MTQSSQRTRRSPIEMVPNADLSTDRLVFRPLGFGDQDAFLGALERSRTSVRRWFPLENKGESSEVYFRRLVETGVLGEKSGTCWRRGAFTADGTFAGVANLIKIDRGLEWTAELNTWIDERQRGQGLGRELVEGVTEHALSDFPLGLGLHAVRAFICPDNTPSRVLFESLGYTRTGDTEMLEINGAVVRHHEFVRRSI